ncbi:UDP glycosyltransferase 9 [Camellia lanceoleosa]|uniref:UDP glycosyltransferase 9 n=1 Tax=Camellia lanceoleosa TaxID=1840588 RepID=A0ACC0HP90_9ERIC|nr:UDP glycosyltransferase 9 [Camellia lanceoleosa]
MKWLDEQPNGSVIYVSFGSSAKLGVDQMEELACGLRGSNCHFLWVVRATEEFKLPKHFVVSWCPQLEVLANEATHCGWNSTLVVPMVAIPQCVIDVLGWESGVQREESGIVRREAVGGCIREVMEGERGREIRSNAMKWRELAREAVDEGGSSDRSIDEFVSKLVHS